MPYNGAGNFLSLSPPQYPAVAGDTIRAAYFNAVIADILAGLTNAVTRDGQSPPTGALPMAGQRHTGVADANAADQYMSYGQLISQVTPVDGLAYFQPQGTGAVLRTLRSVLNDRWSVKNYGAVGDGVTDDTVNIQKAIDAVATAGGGELHFPKASYLLSASLKLATGVRLLLDGSVLLQSTNNTPVIKAPSTGDVQNWAVCNGTLRFVTQQISTQTNGVGLQLADTKLSYDFFVYNLRVDKACDGIMCPGTSGSFAFVGAFRQVIVTQFARWALNIDCDTATGGNTNLVFENCWGLQTAGSPISTSVGFRFRGCSMCRWDSLFADYIQGQFLYMESCTGSAGTLTAEASTFSSAAAQLSVLVFADTNITIQTLRFVTNTFTGGANDLYIVRTTSSGATYKVQITNWLSSGNTYGGTLTNIYEVNPSSGTQLSNDNLVIDRVANLADFTAPFKITRWGGAGRTLYDGSRTTVWGTAAPTTGTWAVGDRCISTNTTGAAPVTEWVCVSAGTPGSWLPSKWIVSRGNTASRPAGLGATGQGVTYLDTTLSANGRLITWTGTLWADSTGASV